MRVLRQSFLAGVIALPLFFSTSAVPRAEAHGNGFGWGLAAGIATAVILNQAYRHHGYYGGYPVYSGYTNYYSPYGGGYYAYSPYPRFYSSYPAPYYGGYHHGYYGHHRH